MSEYFIVNGRVIDPAKKIDAKLNIHVKGGVIAALTQNKKAPVDAEVIDAKDCVVAPGFIDMHVHLRDPGQEYKEDIETGSRAAAAGGFTTICCMPNTDPVNDCAAVTDYILDRASKVGLVDVRPVGAITRGLKGEGMADIGDMASSGICAISDDGKPVMNAGVMRRAMEYAKAFGLTVISHCEDLNLRGSGVMNEGALSTELGLSGMPAEAEDVMVARDITLSELTGTPLHVAHVSTISSAKLVACAKERKLKVTAEVTPHHLTLTEIAVSDYDPNTKVNPPLRTETDRAALIKALADGVIDVIATDHAPHNITDKEMGFQDAAFGIIGMETMLPMVLTLVHDKKLKLSRMIEALTIAPAKILGFKDRGTLAAGSRADIVIFDPDMGWTIQAKNFASKARNTPYDGVRTRGKVKFTFAKGKLIYKV